MDTLSLTKEARIYNGFGVPSSWGRVFGVGDVGMVREVFRTLRAAADVPGIEISVGKGIEVEQIWCGCWEMRLEASVELDNNGFYCHPKSFDFIL